MDDMCALVEYYYSEREGTEYPMVFVGTTDECQKLMEKRHKKRHRELMSSETYSYCYPEDGHAICQDEDGEYRYEWWIRDLEEDKKYMEGYEL